MNFRHLLGGDTIHTVINEKPKSRLLCYVTLRYVTLRYVTLRYVTLRYVTLRYVTLRYVTLRYVRGEVFDLDIKT